jgi:hypothetical protein
MQPVGDLCDLLGVSRHNPRVFDAIVEILDEEGEGSDEAARDARIRERALRFMGRR